jgi:hypothetical protein
MDKQFIAKMLEKHASHLVAQERNINILLDDYDRQVKSLSQLDTKKYGWRVKELEAKKEEAFIKLGFICPNINKINEQIEILLN